LQGISRLAAVEIGLEPSIDEFKTCHKLPTRILTPPRKSRASMEKRYLSAAANGTDVRATSVGDWMPLRVRDALVELLQDHTYAVDLSQDVWVFATGIERLRRFGISDNDIRWMLGKGWLKQGYQINTSNDNGPNLQHSRTLDKRSCFVLTESGVSIAEESTGFIFRNDRDTIPRIDADVNGASAIACRQEQEIEPSWDAERQRLYVGGVLVKEFKMPSPNQSTVLMAFEEEHWPFRIDDPLPCSHDLNPKERLRYTIKSLNKHQKVKAIRFGGDGSGEGIIWESLLV
jgi:hypothetical protein